MAYRKGDIPKVKLDIPNAHKFDLGDLTESMSNMDRLFDNIAKDIKEQKDNAMAMEFTKCIGELLKKNGVVPKITEYTHENVKENSIEHLYGVTIDELDFSEHDSMLKGEIEKLKSELEYEKRNMNYLRTRCMEDATDAFDNRSYGRLTIVGRRVDLEAENDKLKQRIAELESKEIKKPINGWICVVAKEINGQEYVRLEDFMRVVNDLREENRELVTDVEKLRSSKQLEMEKLMAVIQDGINLKMQKVGVTKEILEICVLIAQNCLIF